jgi:hypothetical protein
MRTLKIVTIGMAVLIVLGTTVLILTIIKRSSSSGGIAEVAMVLDEPDGTRIVGIAALQDRLAVHLQGGGVDRVVLIDAKSGVIGGRIALAR